MEPFESDRSCSDCAYMKAIRYGRKNLFFCGKGEEDRRRPRFGAPCPDFEQTDLKRIPRTDRNTGEELPGLGR